MCNSCGTSGPPVSASGAARVRHPIVFTMTKSVGGYRSSTSSGHMKYTFLAAALLAACAAPQPLTRFQGEWHIQALSENTDSVLTTYRLWAPPDTSQWKIKFDNRDDTLPIHIAHVGGDSIVVQAGPYHSALRNASVTTRTVVRLIEGRWVGRSVARYAVTTADSVFRVRTVGVRK